MTVTSTSRTATTDEIVREMDRRGAVIEILEAEFEREKLRADTFERQYRQVCSDLAQAVSQRDAYRDACKTAGICMACVLGAPDTFGCTDCLNTGFDGGQPTTCTGFAAGLEAAAEAANGIEPDLLKGMSERYVSIYCAARVDAADAIKALPTKPALA